MSETKSVTATLRKPFKPEEIGKLPRVTCPKCSNKNTECTEHRKIKCDGCNSYISERHIHIDYVGHADTTSRLLEADPEWSWAPMARDVDPAALAAAITTGDADIVRMVIENSPPKFEYDAKGCPVRLWICLTVGGVTRPGVGTVPSSQGDAEKVLIGDALRNAAMRFGVAVDLWAKGDRADPTAENATASGGQVSRQQPRESFENASPRTNGNGHAANGSTVRPDQPQRAAAVPGSEPDPDAQPYADEAHEARVVDALQAIHTRAREAHKLAALIRNPATNGTGGLGQYLNYRKTLLQKAERALEGLRVAAVTAGIDEAETERRLTTSCGHGIEEASAEEMEKAAEEILESAGTVAV